MRRWLYGLLTVALVPVLVVTSSVQADAGVTVGSTVPFSLELNGNPAETATGDRISCTGNARWNVVDGTAQVDGYVEGTIVCSTGYRISSAIITSIEFQGALGTCSATANDVGQMDGVGSRRFETDDPAFTLPVGSDGQAYAPQCDISRVCVTVDHDSHGTFGWTVTDTECTDVALGASPQVVREAPTSCRWGTVEKPRLSGLSPSHSHSGSTYYDKAMRWRIKTVVPAGTTFSGSSAGWFTYVVVRKSDGTAQAILGSGTGAADESDPTNMYPGAGLGTRLFTVGVMDTHWGHVPLNKTNATGALLDVIGGGVFFAQPPETGSGYAASWSTVKYVGQDGTSGQRGFIGRNDPGYCVFYWGEKLGNTSGTDDEPAGPLATVAGEGQEDAPPPLVEDPVPPASDDSCEGFSFTDPTTWAGAGICVLVKILGRVLNGILDLIKAVGGLAAAIVKGILDGLAALFVPDRDHFEDKLTQVQDAWDDTPPGAVLETVSDLPGMFAAPSSSSCAGPDMPVRLPSFGGGQQSVTMHPLSTCDPAVSKVATVFRLALLAGLWLSAVMLAVRILAASMGLQLSWGKGGDDE